MESPVKIFEFTLIQTQTTARQSVPHGLLVLDEELERQGGIVSYIHKAGQQDFCTDPLVIRANAGDHVKLHLTIASEAANDASFYEYSFTAAEPGILCLRDCFNFRNISGALIIEEAGATFHDIYTDRELAFGTKAVIRRRDRTAFREFVLFVRNNSINWRSEPLQSRLEKNGGAYCFSSIIHGDPATPILETYPGDELMILTVNEDSERERSLCIAGLPGKPENSYTTHINNPYAAGDYLYYFGDENDRRTGLWGILRAHKKPDKYLKPLHTPLKPFPTPPCPNYDTALWEKNVVRKYAAAVIRLNHQSGKKEDSGVWLVPLDSKKRINKKQPPSLTISANAGDWIEFTLYNMLDPSAVRLSLCPQNLSFDPVCHSGVNVGHNQWEQTVKPGKSRTYLWYADRDIVSCRLVALGDIKINPLMFNS